MGFEPMTSSLPRKCSTTELKRLILKTWAGDEVRTRDLQLGRLPLYQLSYSRRWHDVKNVGVTGLEPMNPKEVSYSHPQLPLCDTPIFDASRPIAEMPNPLCFAATVVVVFRKELQN